MPKAPTSHNQLAPTHLQTPYPAPSVAISSTSRAGTCPASSERRTANACRKRHERLMDKRNNQDNWDGQKFETLARAYYENREKIWRILAEPLNEKWEDVERKVCRTISFMLSRDSRSDNALPAWKPPFLTTFYMRMHKCGAAIVFVVVPNLGILVHRERAQNG